jgi:hypothetical protein
LGFAILGFTRCESAAAIKPRGFLQRARLRSCGAKIRLPKLLRQGGEKPRILQNIAALPGTNCITHSSYNAPIDETYFFFLFLALVLRFVAPFLARFFSFFAFSMTMIFSSS